MAKKNKTGKLKKKDINIKLTKVRPQTDKQKEKGKEGHQIGYSLCNDVRIYYCRCPNQM
jgi:hypothetical protein